eukprot:206532_1
MSLSKRGILHIIFCIIIVVFMALNSLQWSQKLDLQTRKKIVSRWLEGEKPQKIAERFLTSRLTVDRLIKRWLEFGHVNTITETKQQLGINKYKKLLNNPVLEDNLIDQSLRMPSTTLKQYQNQLMNRFGVYASQSSLHRFFIDQNITWKKGGKRAIESNPLDVNNFIEVLTRICTNRNQLVCGDETHRNDTTANARYGRSAKY